MVCNTMCAHYHTRTCFCGCSDEQSAGRRQDTDVLPPQQRLRSPDALAVCMMLRRAACSHEQAISRRVLLAAQQAML